MTNEQLRIELQKQKELLKKVILELKAEREENEAYRARREVARKEHEVFKAQTEAARKKFSSVINDLNQEKEALKNKLKKPGAANAGTFADGIQAANGKHGPNHSMIYDRTIKTIYLEIHEDLDEVLESMIEDRAAARDKLDQKVLKETTEDNETIVHWTLVDQIKHTSINLLLRLKVERDVNGEIRIAVASIEEGDLDTTCLPIPKPTTAKAFRFLLNGGSILLKPLSLGRTSFTLTAQADLREEVQFNNVYGSPSHGADSIENLKTGFASPGKKIRASAGSKMMRSIMSASSRVSAGSGTAKRGDSMKAGELLGEVVGQFYKRFEKEAVIDERRKKDLIENVGNAPALTECEQDLIAESMKLVEEFSAKAKRIAGTVNDSVEKFFLRDGETGVGWAFSVARVDVRADTLFADLWLIDTYAKKAENKGSTIRELWTNLDGTRSRQCTRSFKVPGFQDRIFEAWQTWERTEDGDKRPTFILAISPLEHYDGTHHEVAGTENMEKFKRNGKEVDRERAAALAGKMIERRGEKLMEDQVAIFASCEEFLRDGGDERWKALESTSKDVEMSMKYFPPEKGGRSIGTGKAVGVVDGSAEEVAAWAMDYCSNERMRMNREAGNMARLELREKARVNENTVATVKTFPFFLENREFVVRNVWKSEERMVLIAFESVDDEIDYGAKLKKTRGLTRGLWQIEDLPLRGGAKQCQVMLVQQLDAGGSLPSWLVNQKVPLALSAVQEAIDEFRQDEKVDAAELREKATFIRERGQDEEYSEEENALLERVRKKFEGSLKEGNWKQLKSPDVFVKMGATFEESGSSAAIGRAITVVDATIEDCATLEYARMTRKEMKLHYDFDFGVGSFAPREWLVKCVWKMVDENTIIVGVEDIEDDSFPHGAGKKYVRASSGAFWKYERLPDKNGVPQTRVAFYQQADLKGFIPAFVVNSKIVGYLEYLSTMRKKFDKSLDIDARRRAEIAKKIKLEEDAGGAEALAQFEALFEEREGSERPSRSFGLADSKVQANAVGGKGWGSTSVNVRAEMEEVAAFFWDFDSRANMQISRDVERTFEEDEEGAGGFKKIVKRHQQISSSHGGQHHDRSFASEMTLKRADDDTIIILMAPLADGQYERATVLARGSVIVGNADAIEVKETAAIRLRRLGGGRTKLELSCEIDLGFGIKCRSVKHFVERRLGEIIGVSVYFQRLVPLKEYGLDDGIALAHDLLWTAPSAKKRVERLAEAFEKSRALRELAETLTWIKAMLAVAIEGGLHRNIAITTKLVCVSEKEAIRIGKNLMPALKSRKVIGAGVDQWRGQNPAVGELMDEHNWVEQMMLVLSKGIVKTAAWGLMWRVTLGAVLSLGDLVTDLIVLKRFFYGGDEMMAYRDASIACLATSIIGQMILVAVQNRKKGMLRILKEVVIIVMGMKAAADAYRVASGAEHEKDTAMDPMTELTVNKLIEMFAESIPGIIIQTSAIISELNSGVPTSSMAYISLLFSTLTTGFVSATLSYDYDTDPKKRAANPEFYGYVPDDARKRAVLFVTMTLMSSNQVLIHGILVVILGSIARSYALYYLVGNMLLYFFYKAVRGDLRHWIPINGLTGSSLSVLLRLLIKFVVDFTGCIQFRHPYDVGGLYFTLNLFLPLIGLTAILAAGLLKETFTGEKEEGEGEGEEEGGSNEVTIKFITSLTVVLGTSLIILVGLFFALIDGEYRHTFFSVETGGQMTRRNFWDGSDVMKSQVFGVHETLWAPIREKVEAWVKAGWNNWEEERPEWLTHDRKARVPREMIPMKKGGGYEADEADEGSPVAARSAVVRQKASRKNSVHALINAALVIKPVANKVAPEGVKKEQVFDKKEFMREMERRGSVNL
ncbi:hypothetical protein TL16_g01910 [Triparma laevis f. inornata]|uniref:START domain-containing protein n=1 Tax=Triparma laevis f. inornata TaxID=1714386 RepID=A0A9W6ZNZ3_9STRA|nr:hypothetical protein TL16_g01910 [Triparma laevis f. inornata]